jgi:hypothetical protein
MKVRFGHVSNSSTSSFFGIGILRENIKGIREEFLPTKEDDKYHEFLYDDGSVDLDSSDLWKWLTKFYSYDGATTSKASEILNTVGIEDTHCEYQEGLFVSYTRMKFNETKRQFIDRISKALHTVFEIDESDIGHMDYAWRNG